MAYEYDVFISVNFKPFYSEWVREHFIPTFKAFVEDSVLAKCNRPFEGFFYYKDDIEPGDDWRDELKEAIPRSRCALALCSPGYFQSVYCRIEWTSFWNRGNETQTKLIVPVSIHDGESFPDYARARQIKRLNEYVIPGEGFKKSEDYPNFVREIRELADSVANKVKDAPDFQNWTVAGSEHLQPPEAPEINLRTI